MRTSFLFLLVLFVAQYSSVAASMVGVESFGDTCAVSTDNTGETAVGAEMRADGTLPPPRPADLYTAHVSANTAPCLPDDIECVREFVRFLIQTVHGGEPAGAHLPADTRRLLDTFIATGRGDLSGVRAATCPLCQRPHDAETDDCRGDWSAEELDACVALERELGVHTAQAIHLKLARALVDADGCRWNPSGEHLEKAFRCRAALGATRRFGGAKRLLSAKLRCTASGQCVNTSCIRRLRDWPTVGSVTRREAHMLHGKVLRALPGACGPPAPESGGPGDAALSRAAAWPREEAAACAVLDAIGGPRHFFRSVVRMHALLHYGRVECAPDWLTCTITIGVHDMLRSAVDLVTLYCVRTAEALWRLTVGE